ncbi:MAG TPA: SDR family oxidoreductase [Candidatus Angelobacter sp.]|nr:SDR family oxidoreductase [Candidatus Angelobacter sp.]
MSDLKGKTVLITGGARRLGRAIALAMASAGAKTAFTYLRSEPEAQQTLQQIREKGAEGLAIHCDVRQEASIQAAIKQVCERFKSIDLLVNNAGVFQTAELQEITTEQWDEVFAVNVRGAFLTSKACIPELRRAHGRIIHLGSLGGEKPWITHPHYCSSKAALHMLTRVMAKDLAPEIAVNCVAPGMINTGEEEKDPTLLDRLAKRTPMQTNGTPQDIVSAVMYFAASPHFVTGQILTVDGGLGLV